jgi:multidrug resistance efflux pump
LEVGIEAGEVVTPGVQQTFEGRPLMVVGDLSTLVVKSELNQIDIAKIEVGDLAELSFDALPGRRFSARVTKTAPAAVLPKGKTVEVFPVEATLTETSTTIRPGMTADVRFAIDTRRVVRDKGDAFVTKIVSVEGKPRTERVAVRLGARSDRQVEVAEGIVEGDELLIDPASSKANEIAL